MPISGGSGTSVTASLAGQAPPMVAPVPSAGRANMGVQGAPSEVMEQPVTTAIPLPIVGQMGLSSALMAPTVVGTTQPVVNPPTQVEVVAAVTDGSQQGATVASPVASTQPVPSAAQAMAPSMGRIEGDMVEGSSDIVVLGEGLVFVPLMPSVTRGIVLARMSW